MKDVTLHKQNYKLFPSEEILSRKEIDAILSPSELIEDGDIIIAKDCHNQVKADKLTFISSYLVLSQWLHLCFQSLNNNMELLPQIQLHMYQPS